MPCCNFLCLRFLPFLLLLFFPLKSWDPLPIHYSYHTKLPSLSLPLNRARVTSIQLTPAETAQKKSLSSDSQFWNFPFTRTLTFLDKGQLQSACIIDSSVCLQIPHLGSTSTRQFRRFRSVPHHLGPPNLLSPITQLSCIKYQHFK